jgi:hypothetical protein
MSSSEAVTPSTPEVSETPEAAAAPAVQAAPQTARASAAPVTANGALNVGFGLILGLVGTALAYDRAPALGFALYVFLLISALFLSARLQRSRPIRRNLFIVVPVLFFAAMLAVRSDPVLIAFNLLVATFAALLLVYYFANGNLAQQDFIGYGLKSLLTSFIVWVKPVEELIQARKWLAKHHLKWQTLLPFVRGLVITVPILAVFVILLSSADTVFNQFVQDFFDLFKFRNMYNLGGYLTFGLLLGWTAVGGLAYALGDRKAKRAPTPATYIRAESDDGSEPRTAPIFSLGLTETLMVLVSVCALFALFVAIQAVYLFGGQQNISIEKFKYADYVHRGFAELIVVGLLVLGLTYLLNIVAIRRNRFQTNLVRGLISVLVVLTLVILMSAFRRLQLYEEAYGVTSLRLLVYVFIVWLGILFVGFILSLYWQPTAINVFGMATLFAIFGFVATLNLINPDAFVAREIIDRGDIDPIYLSTLSVEAVPSLVSLLDAPEPGTRQIMQSTLLKRLNRLKGYGDLRDFTLAYSTWLP